MNSVIRILTFAAASILLGVVGLLADESKKPETEQKLPTTQEMLSSLEGKSGEGLRGIQVGEPPKMTVHLHFRYDSTELVTKEEKEWIQKVAAEVFNSATMKPYKFIIEGHTDKRGSDTYNLELSERRANAIREMLIKQGIPADRLRAQGKGKLELVAGGDTEDDHQKNRRVVFIRE